MENVEYKEVEEIQEIQEEQKMPVFLKVLCILSFIYIGIILIPSIFGLFSGPMSETELNETFQNVSSLVPNSISKKEKAHLLELAYEKQKVMNDLGAARPRNTDNGSRRHTSRGLLRSKG